MARAEPHQLRRGKAFHRTVQEDWHRTAEGMISSEMAILKPTGRKGRIDVHADSGNGDLVAVVEVKATNWNPMTDAVVRRNVRRQARQIGGYIESQLADGRTVYPGVIFPGHPPAAKRLRLVETLFEAEGISVVWYDETIEERKARADKRDAG